MISRRELLGGIAASRMAAARKPPRSVQVALQLFSVRKQCASDLPATLARVKQIGFEAVELAGNQGHSAEEFRQLLRDHELLCCGAHVSPAQLQSPKYDETAAFMQALGNRRVIVPGLPANYTQTADGWREAASLFTGLSSRLAKDGLELGYHNHSLEFKALESERPIDIFLHSTPPDVFLELDLGGAGYGGANPVQVLETYRSRVRMIHVKDYTATKPDLMIGTGSVDWRRLLRDTSGSAVEWYIIEHDSVSGPDLADIADSHHRFVELVKTAG